jgi:hypothetical protein
MQLTDHLSLRLQALETAVVHKVALNAIGADFKVFNDWGSKQESLLRHCEPDLRARSRVLAERR